MTVEGVEITLYEGLGWKCVTAPGEDDRIMSVLLITSPDGGPVDLTSDTINPYHKALKSDSITLMDVTVTHMEADAQVVLQNAVIEDGTFQQMVSTDENSIIAGGNFWQEVSANGSITGGTFQQKVRVDGSITKGTFLGSVEANGKIAGGSFQQEVSANGSITGGTFMETVRANGKIAGGTFQQNVYAYDKITDGQFDADVYLGSDGSITGGVFNNITLSSYVSDATVIQNAMITGRLIADNYSKAAVSDTVSFNFIDARHIPGNQQQSRLSITDGKVESVNNVNVTQETTELYRIGDVEMNITFSTPVKTINGAPASDYTGAQLSGKTLTLTALNDGAPIVVNRADGKIPFSDLTKDDFDIDETPDGADVTCKKDGVGNPRLVYVRTYDKAAFTSIPANEPGIYKKRVVADEDGENYTSGSIDAGETVIKYTPTPADFVCDFETGTVTYNNGERYFGDEVPQAKLVYYDGEQPYDHVPTKAGTYEVSLEVENNDYYDGDNYQLEPYTVRYTPVAENFTYDAAQNTVTYNGKKYNDADPDMTLLYGTDTDRSETVPTAPGSYNVYVQVTADENYNGTTTGKVGTYVVKGAPTFALTVKNAQVTLKDGSDVADLTAVPAGTELKATANPDTDTAVFEKWIGLELTEEQSTKRVLEFTMPDHDVELTANFGTPSTTDPEPTPTPTPTPTPDPEPTPTPTPTPDPEPTPTPTPTPTPAPAPSDDGGGAIVMVAAVGGAAVGVGAYIAGTTAYLKSVLPEGVAIPANRQQLAVALWTAAGKPATQSTALFNDVAADAAELQAIRWAVDTGLMSAQDGSFKPGNRVSRLEVIRTWKTYQQRG